MEIKSKQENDLKFNYGKMEKKYLMGLIAEVEYKLLEVY
jgi:hypothetical protein